MRYALIVLTVAVSTLVGQSAAQEFSTPAIDLGVVVRDLDASMKFYTEAIGMKPAGGFSVPGDFAAKAGLSDNKTLHVKNLILGEGAVASKLKLMAFEGTNSETTKNDFIHSTLGFSYLTIHVTDTDAAMRRLEKAGVKPLKATPIALPAPLPTHVFITLVRDPDGNFVELVGPKKGVE